MRLLLFLLLFLSACDAGKLLDKNLPYAGAGGGGSSFKPVKFESAKTREYKSIQDKSFFNQSGFEQINGSYRIDFKQAYDKIGSRFSLIDKPQVAEYFTSKGNKYLSNSDIQPEQPNNWIKGGEINNYYLNSYRADVLKFSSTQNKNENPQQLANLQANFDCWVAEESLNIDEQSLQCKETFVKSLRFFKEKEVPHVFSNVGVLPNEKKTEKEGSDAKEYLDELEEKDGKREEFSELNINYKGRTLAELKAEEPKKVLVLYFTEKDVSKLDNLDTEQLKALNKFNESIKKQEPYKILVNSHTDTAGEAITNQILSLRRAEMVKDNLVKLGCSDENIFTFAFGESESLYKTADEVEDKTLNKVEILLY
jgi:outer membrane protein OmpA-like peptidoglycan-associated protein